MGLYGIEEIKHEMLCKCMYMYFKVNANAVCQLFLQFQTALKHLPKLLDLDLSECQKITDEAFLLDERIQFSRETQKKLFGEWLPESLYPCQLRSIDVSACHVTSAGVRHITTLCGPTLQHISISWSKVKYLFF